MAAGTLAKVGASVLAFGAGAGLTFVRVDPSDATPTPVAQAWVDRPLDGSSLPEGDVQLIAHATDPDGLDRVVLSIDGVEVHTEQGDGRALVTVDTTWSPPGPGTYALEVVGTDGGGHDGEPATATFTVGEPDDVAITTTTRDGSTSTSVTPGGGSTTITTDGASTTTNTGPGTTTPTTTGTTSTTRPTTTSTRPPPCRPAIPAPRTPADDATITDRTPLLTWNYTACGPDHFTVQVADNDLFLSGRGLYVASVDVPGANRNVTWAPLPCPRTYYWRIRAVDEGGTSAWSAVRTFNVDC